MQCNTLLLVICLDLESDSNDLFAHVSESNKENHIISKLKSEQPRKSMQGSTSLLFFALASNAHIELQSSHPQAPTCNPTIEAHTISPPRAASGCEPLSFNIWWTLALAMSLPHTNLGFPLQPSKSPAMLFYTRLGNKLVWKKRVLKHFDSETNASVGCLALNKNDGGSGIMGRLWWQR